MWGSSYTSYLRVCIYFYLVYLRIWDTVKLRGCMWCTYYHIYTFDNVCKITHTLITKQCSWKHFKSSFTSLFRRLNIRRQRMRCILPNSEPGLILNSVSFLIDRSLLVIYSRRWKCDKLWIMPLCEYACCNYCVWFWWIVRGVDSNFFNKKIGHGLYS